MKSVDVDARHLIRTYIDGIEEYLRGHTRLHPNEIDSLLNEINDFVYLRSGELATGDRVHYNDVLKAIEECGSPSEICEQYLELDRDDQPAPFSPKVVAPPKATQPALKSPEVEEYPVKPQVSPKRFQSRLDMVGFYYRRVPWFAVYRVLSLFGMVMLNIALLRYNIFYGRVWVNDFYNIWGYDRCLQTTMVAFFAVIWEGWLISSWKERLVQKKGFNRSMDDTMVVYTSRFTFLMVFLKASLLFLPAYLIFTPIWVVLACIMERQMKSALWQEKLGPWIIVLGSSLTNGGQNQSRERFVVWWTKFRNQFSDLEKIVIAFLIAILGVTFSFPWIALRTGYSEGILHYTSVGLPEAAVIFVILSLVTMGGVLMALWYYNSSHELASFTGKSELIAWLMRLLAFKAILILDFVFIYSVFVFGSLIILGVLIIFEIVSNTYGGKTFRQWFGNVLVSFGNTSSHQISTVTSETPSKMVLKEQSIPVRSKTIRMGEIEPTPPIIEKQAYTYERRPSRLSWLFSGISSLSKAFIMTFWLLFVSFYEMALTYVVLVTSFGDKGEYEVVPLNFGDYTFSIFPITTTSYSTEGYILYMWHTLLLLGIQLFFIAIVQWHGLASKKPEGTVLRVCRNLTRIFLGVIAIASLVHIFYGDIYGHLKLLIIFGLLFFSEITTWKVHSERSKQMVSLKSQQEIPVPVEEGMKSNLVNSTKTS